MTQAGGTYTKFTAKRRAAMLALVREGATRTAAARAIGVDPKTVYTAAHEGPEHTLTAFGDELEDAEMEKCDLVEDALFQAAVSGNVVAVQVYLYNRAPDRWADRRSNRAAESSTDGVAPIALLAETILRVLASPALDLTPTQVIAARSQVASQLRELDPAGSGIDRARCAHTSATVGAV